MEPELPAILFVFGLMGCGVGSPELQTPPEVASVQLRLVAKLNAHGQADGVIGRAWAPTEELESNSEGCTQSIPDKGGPIARKVFAVGIEDQELEWDPESGAHRWETQDPVGGWLDPRWRTFGMELEWPGGHRWGLDQVAQFGGLPTGVRQSARAGGNLVLEFPEVPFDVTVAVLVEDNGVVFRCMDRSGRIELDSRFVDSPVRVEVLRETWGRLPDGGLVRGQAVLEIPLSLLLEEAAPVQARSGSLRRTNPPRRRVERRGSLPA